MKVSSDNLLDIIKGELGVLDDMVIGQYIPSSIYDYPGTRTLSRDEALIIIPLHNGTGDVHHPGSRLSVDFNVVIFLFGKGPRI